MNVISSKGIQITEADKIASTVKHCHTYVKAIESGQRPVMTSDDDSTHISSYILIGLGTGIPS